MRAGEPINFAPEVSTNPIDTKMTKSCYLCVPGVYFHSPFLGNISLHYNIFNREIKTVDDFRIYIIIISNCLSFLLSKPQPLCSGYWLEREFNWNKQCLPSSMSCINKGNYGSNSSLSCFCGITTTYWFTLISNLSTILLLRVFNLSFVTRTSDEKYSIHHSLQIVFS